MLAPLILVVNEQNKIATPRLLTLQSLKKISFGIKITLARPTILDAISYMGYLP